MEKNIKEIKKFKNFANYVRRQDLAKFLAKFEIFKKQLTIKGSIVECGVHEGNGLFTWAHFSSILEPYNYHRKIIGFDTFKGFTNIKNEDKKNKKAIKGKFKENYDTYQNIIKCKKKFDNNRFLNNKEKIELIKGDATKTIPKYLNKNKHMLVSLLYIDFDLYTPARVALKNFLPLMSKGGIICFDEVNNPDWPGETQALLKSLSIKKHKLQNFDFEPNISFIQF